MGASDYLKSPKPLDVDLLVAEQSLLDGIQDGDKDLGGLGEAVEFEYLHEHKGKGLIRLYLHVLCQTSGRYTFLGCHQPN